MTAATDAETVVANPFIGMVAPYDFALDRELWRWVPDTAHLLLTRTPYEAAAGHRRAGGSGSATRRSSPRRPGR